MSGISAKISDFRRLESLRALGLLDKSAEESFDRIARLTALLLGVPVAAVTLVDSDRVFMKSCIGVPEHIARTRETPLNHSICQYVVESDSILAVGDTRQDPLLKDNAGVQSSGAVAYLGAPLKTVDGLTLGSLCGLDAKPRKAPSKRTNRWPTFKPRSMR